MRLQEEKSWFAGVAEYVKLINPTDDGEADSKEFAKLDEYIEQRNYQKVMELCMKYGEQEKEVSSAGFVKHDTESKQNPLKGFCQYVVARLYETVAEDNEKASEFYNASASNGCVYAVLRYAEVMATNSEDENERTEGLRIIKNYALEGYPMAVVMYAQLLIEKNESKSQTNFAFELLRTVNSYDESDKHFLEEHLLYYLFGKCYEEGIGTPKNEKLAMLAYKNSISCYPPNEFYGNLDVCMEVCQKMVEKDTAGETVFNVLKQVAEQGYLDAVMLVVDTYIKTHDRKCEQVLEDVSKVALAYDGLAEAEKGRVYYALSMHYFDIDGDKALSNLMKASSLKNPEAMVLMVYCWSGGGLGLARDENQAYKLLDQVAKMDGVSEETMTEVYSLMASLVSQNAGQKEWATTERMVESLKMAKDLGDAESMTELALLTLNDVCETGMTKEEAKQMVETYLEADEQSKCSATLMFNLAKIYTTPTFNKDADEILNILDDALIISTDDAEILDFKGEFLLNLERDEEAAEVWEQLNALYPEYVEAMKEHSEFVKKMQEEGGGEPNS